MNMANNNKIKTSCLVRKPWNSRWVCLLIGCLGLVGSSTPSAAQDATNIPPIRGDYISPPADAQLFLARPTTSTSSAGGIQIEGGLMVVAADLQFWRGVRQISDDGDGAKYCTVSLIGPRVLITAAHCIPDAEHFRISVEGTDPKAPIPVTRCDLLRNYRDPQFDILVDDVAVCVLESEVTNVRYESIILESALPASVALVGYGCASYDVKDHGGTLRIGIGTPILDPGTGDSLISSLKGLSTEILIVSGTARLCPGDSGGPVFAQNCTSTNPDPSLGRCVRRGIVAINSSRAFSTTTDEPLGFSFVTPLNTKTVRDFIRQWVDANGLMVCGVSMPDPGKCRRI